VQPLLVRTADVPAQPWKDGGGVTRELLALPEGGAWRVRISVADVASDGPFSTFAGVDRWFAVLDGAGVELTIDGNAQRVTADDDALAFAGAAQTRCLLIDGPTRDLNLMLRGVAGALARVVPGEMWRPDARACGLYATAAGACRIGGHDDRPAAIPAQALCWWHDAPTALAFDGSGWWLRAETAGEAMGAVR
jgi:environmental stress-induced protein Ves